ncbi:hypothetical protein FKW77_000995 [Venturia effusa]|uniref:Xylanolytic transcriptional activator regulatory domain-containing protein n=1 Tax=Venturia effusa TaxID=50376 RepID=A0A517L2Q1_9PEZI|nr:hypothetical protein FKW77_000995 [Venturia effusa]
MSEDAILEEVHNWLGLSLDFLVQDQIPEYTRHDSHSPRFTEKCLVDPGDAAYLCAKSPPLAILTPPASTDWESPSAEPGAGGDEDVVMADGPSPIERQQQESPVQLVEQDFLSFGSISNYAFESPIALLEQSCGIVLGPFLEDLLRIYFQNIHPYYPVVDEFDFDVSFSQTIDDEVLRQSRAMVLCAMFLCASMYLNTTYLHAATTLTQPSLQKQIFSTFKDLYEAHTSTHSHFNLTQACMLLSYWSPCYTEPTHFCSAWLSKAFTHAKSAGLDQTTSEVMTDRSRLIWCSLVIRDRVISFSSRRPLHPLAAKGTHYRVKREDFGLEVCLPRYSSPSERGDLVEAFLLQCRLSEVLADIIEFEMGMRRGLKDGRVRIGRKEVLRVSEFDVRLREWKRGFRFCTRRREGYMEGGVVDGRGSFYLRSVVAESAIATLYIPFIQQQTTTTSTTTTDPLLTTFALTALQKVKDASARASETIRDLLATVPTHQMPPFLSLWLPLPILTLLVSLKFTRHHPHPPHHNHHHPSTKTLREQQATDTTHRLRHLFSALAVFRLRYRSGRFILDLVQGICRELGLGMWDAESMRFEEPAVPGEGETEAGTLMRAAALVELGVGCDGSGSSDR